MLKRFALSLILTVGLVHGASAGTPEGDRARADIKAKLGFVPGFFTAMPDLALPSVWAEFTTLQMSPTTRLSVRTKELIGLAVASQVPCRYCIYAHTEFAALAGATKAEIGEAVAMAALTRHWSTFMNGLMLDEQAFRSSIDAAVTYLRSPPKDAKATTRTATAPSDPGQAALAEARAAFGAVPEFLARFPAAALPAAWQGLRDVELAETTISAKDKSLIGLAVASQIPCRYCVIADTTFARLAGATDDEITEAIAMSSFVRLMSTYLNGLQVDEAGFKADVDRLVKAAKKAAASR